MSLEDRMVNALIHRHQSYEGSLYEKIESTVEAHYNHYGTRGVADLYVVEHDSESRQRYAHVYEVKADSAVRNATGANEILRQYNKMRKYFFEDESYSIADTIDINLYFVATERTVEHIGKNYEMYRSAHDQNLCEYHTQSISNPERVVVASLSDCQALPLSISDDQTAAEWAESASEVHGVDAADVVASVLG